MRNRQIKLPQSNQKALYGQLWERWIAVKSKPQ